jgi:hypothetical protein
MTNPVVTHAVPISGERITVSGRIWGGEYERYSTENWMQQMGNSMEPVFNCELLEIAYQEFKRCRP